MCRRSTVLAPLLGVVALLVLVVRAAARPPVTQNQIDTGTFVVAENCPGGYDVVLSWNNTIRMTTFYDAAGEVVRVVSHVYGSGTMSNSVTGYTLEGGSRQSRPRGYARETRASTAATRWWSGCT